jgi:saccharopine dehydrogenase-like NADP-dependent oxidoreductase
MKKILILGAGRSSSALIEYLLKESQKNEWQIKVADTSLEMAQEKINGDKNGKAIQLDINNETQRENEIKDADLVISLLPPSFHLSVAETCVALSKSLFTASYVTTEIQMLHAEAEKKGILILTESGLDPGIDHMSAVKEINNIKSKGGKITSFRSYTGGLIAPESDNNPWHYKVTWNPRNVVLAGQGTVKYLEGGRYKFIPYHQLFRRLEKIFVEDTGEFEGYANRDSLKYIKTYGLENIPTFIRGTLRKPGFCSAWNCLVQLGMTDDSFIIDNSESMTLKEFTASFLDDNNINTVQRTFCNYVNIHESSNEMLKIKWLGLFSNDKIGIPQATPAQVIQKLVTEKWKLRPEDKDMIVMQHMLEYELNGKNIKLSSSLAVKGKDPKLTAMAMTVGFPLGIAAKLFLQGKMNLKGVHIPVMKEIYEPVLNELAGMGIEFKNVES